MLGEMGEKPPTQVARLQGRTELKLEPNFALLLRLIAPKERGVLWSLNLGELTFDPSQLVRLRQALSEPTCTITHLFIDPLKLTQRYSEPEMANTSLVEAQKVADLETKKDGNRWKHIFIALIRANRTKHDLFYFSADEAQNAVIRQAVNNWYNPTSHARNQKWNATRKQKDRDVRPPGESLDRTQLDRDTVVATVQAAQTTLPVWATGWDRLFDSEGEPDTEDDDADARNKKATPAERGKKGTHGEGPVAYTHLTLPTKKIV